MKKIKFQSPVGIGSILLFSLNITLLITGLIIDVVWFVIIPIILSVTQIILYSLFIKRQSALLKHKLKPLSGKVRFLVPKFLLRHKFLRTTVSTWQYELIFKRANNLSTSSIVNTLSHPDDPNFEWIKQKYGSAGLSYGLNLTVQVGTIQCSQPYSLSVLNIDTINHCFIDNKMIQALAEGANIRGFAVNTGKAGISPYLMRGGCDLIWQIAHRDSAFCKEDGSFNEKLFEVTAKRPYIRMIEIVLPRCEHSIMKRLAGDRMVGFLKRLRELSEGKPIGIRLFNPGLEVINGICKSMQAAGIYIDFITIDSTSFASDPDSFSVSSASNIVYFESLNFVKEAIRDYGLPTKIIASGAVVSEYDILRAIALGASACYCTVPMMIAAESGRNFKLMDAVGKRVRVANFHRNTIDATIKLMEVSGYSKLEDVKTTDFYRKQTLLK